MKNNKLHLILKATIIAVCISLVAGIVLLLVHSHSLATVDGTYHQVKKGETLLQISRAYDVDMEKIKKANPLSSTRIRVGQNLFIPGAEKAVKIEPQDRQIRSVLRYATSDRWKYIIIHHSETREGSAEVFDKYHREKRHFRYGLAYHFVICNGTSRRKDGQIQVGQRWKKQMDGAHCKAGNGNRIGIGICLVGNFNKTGPTRKQLDSLIHLVTHLCYRYDIPLKNIKGHKEMQGAETDCPGKNFPWEKFKKALSERGRK